MTIVSLAVQDVLSRQFQTHLDFGREDWPDGTDAKLFRREAKTTLAALKAACERRQPTFSHFALAGLYGCLATDDPATLRNELVWVTAQLIEWIESLDRRLGIAQ